MKNDLRRPKMKNKFSWEIDFLLIKTSQIEDLDEKISWALEISGPSLLAIRIDKDEIFPPLRSKIEQRKRDLMTK